MCKSPNLTIVGLATALCFGASVAMANPVCTIENWSSSVGMDTNGTGFSVGAPSGNNRRFAGPCGLRVNVDGTARYLVDNSPSNETSFNTRFYFFVNGTLPDGAVIFSALTDASGADVLRLRNTSSGVVLDGATSSAFASTTASALASGWNYVEISWDQATASLSLNGAAAKTISSGLNDQLTIGSVRLGNVSGANGSNVSIDFDDYDSRRTSMPVRLLAGAADDGVQVNAAAIVAVRNELLGNALAAGQPDCDMNGEVGASDIVCIRNILLGNN